MQFIKANVNPAPTQQAAPMVRGPGRFVVANDFRGATAMPQVNVGQFVSARLRAGQAIGEGVQGLAAGVNRIATIRNEVANRRAVAEADATLRLAQGDLAKSLAEHPNDTSKWEEIAQQHIARVGGALTQKGLSPDALEQIKNRRMEWSAGVLSSTREQAASREIQLLGSQHEANFISAMDAADWGQALRSIESAKADGVLNPAGEARRMAELHDAQRRSELQSFDLEAKRLTDKGDYEGVMNLWSGREKPQGIDSDLWEQKKQSALLGIQRQRDNDALAVQLFEDPKGGQEILATPGALPAFSTADVAEWRQKMAAAREQKAGLEVESAERAIALLPPDKLKDATPDSLGVKMPQATDFHRALVAEKLKVRQGKAALDSEGNYLDDLKAATSYDPSRDPQGIAAIRLRQLWATRYTPTGPMADKLESALKLREKGEPSQVQIGPAVTALKEWAEQGAFGPYKIPVMMDGAQVTKPGEKLGTAEKPGWLWGTNTVDVYADMDGNPTTQEKPSVPVTQDDPMLKAKADAKVKAIVDQLGDEVKAGRFKTNDEVLERARSLAEKAGVRLPQIKVKAGELPPPVPPPGYKQTPTLFPTTPPSSDALDALLKRYGK